MIVKVCGMQDSQNIKDVAAIRDIDWLGFIFYPRSPRYVGEAFDPEVISGIKKQKIGVFVNETFEKLLDFHDRYHFDYLQLHGTESPDLCHSLQKRGIHLIKAFSVETEKDLKRATDYEGYVDYFLFDTKCPSYGGSGKLFNWNILAAYTGKTPFLLSGGINLNSNQDIQQFSHPRFAGIDLNSGFETKPGFKEIDKLRSFFSLLTINH